MSEHPGEPQCSEQRRCLTATDQVINFAPVNHYGPLTITTTSPAFTLAGLVSVGGAIGFARTRSVVSRQFTRPYNRCSRSQKEIANLTFLPSFPSSPPSLAPSFCLPAIPRRRPLRRRPLPPGSSTDQIRPRLRLRDCRLQFFGVAGVFGA